MWGSELVPEDAEIRASPSRRLYIYLITFTKVDYESKKNIFASSRQETRLRFPRVSSAGRRTRRVSTTTSSPDSNATATVRCACSV